MEYMKNERITNMAVNTKDDNGALQVREISCSSLQRCSTHEYGNGTAFFYKSSQLMP